MSLVQLPAIAISMYGIEHQKGTKVHTHTNIYSSSGVLRGCYQQLYSHVCSLSVSMFFISIWLHTLYPYTGEVYHTSIRSLAFGSLSIAGRTGEVMAPLLLLELKALDDCVHFQFLGLVSLFLPYETPNTELDMHTN